MDKVVKVSSWLVIGLVICAVASISAYNIIGSSVDAEGVVQEPFFLIGLFWLFLLFSIFLGIVNILMRVIRARRKKR